MELLSKRYHKIIDINQEKKLSQKKVTFYFVFCEPNIYLCTVKTKKQNIMKKIELRKLHKGDYFHHYDDYDSPLWVRDTYDRSSKRLTFIRLVM